MVEEHSTRLYVTVSETMKGEAASAAQKGKLRCKHVNANMETYSLMICTTLYESTVK